MGTDEIREKIKGKKIIIFGASERAKKIDEILKKNSFDFAYFVDNDPKREHELYLNKIIYNPLELLYEDPQDIFILVTVIAFDEVYQQLEGMGFTKDVHFIFPIEYLRESMSGYYKKCDRIDPHLGYSRSDDISSFTIYGDLSNSSAIRIVTLGGSTTDSTVAKIASWPEQLYGILKRNNIEAIVYNGGIVSYGAAQELIKLLRDVIPLRPDIVLSFSGVNDVNLRTSVTGHPMVHIYQDIILKHVMSKFDNFFCGGVNTAIKEQDYGIYNEINDYQHWMNCVRMMHAVTNEFDIRYLCFLQPMLGIGKYCLNEKEERMMQFPDEDVMGHYGLHAKLVEGISGFYNRVKPLTAACDYVVDLTNSFDNLSDIYIDLSHVNEQGNIIIAENIFNELVKRGMVKK